MTAGSCKQEQHLKPTSIRYLTLPIKKIWKFEKHSFVGDFVCLVLFLLLEISFDSLIERFVPRGNVSISHCPSVPLQTPKHQQLGDFPTSRVSGAPRSPEHEARKKQRLLCRLVV